MCIRDSDNFDADGSGESLIIPLQNMINTLYSKDISRKVSTALKAQIDVYKRQGTSGKQMSWARRSCFLKKRLTWQCVGLQKRR